MPVHLHLDLRPHLYPALVLPRCLPRHTHNLRNNNYQVVSSLVAGLMKSLLTF